MKQFSHAKEVAIETMNMMDNLNIPSDSYDDAYSLRAELETIIDSIESGGFPDYRDLLEFLKKKYDNADIAVVLNVLNAYRGEVQDCLECCSFLMDRIAKMLTVLRLIACFYRQVLLKIC